MFILPKALLDWKMVVESGGRTKGPGCWGITGVFKSEFGKEMSDTYVPLMELLSGVGDLPERHRVSSPSPLCLLSWWLNTTVSVTSAYKALVLPSLTEMQCCSCWSHQRGEMWLQKPLWCGQGAASPWLTGEAAAEQPGVCGQQLPQIKPDKWSCCEASGALQCALCPRSHAEIHATTRSCVCFSRVEVKGNKAHLQSLACASLALLCPASTRSLCCPAEGSAFLSHNSLQTAVIKSRAHSAYCCVFAVFSREHIPLECV